jgi:hypothetical protein
MTAAEELRTAYDAVRADLLKLDPACPVELVRDVDGRYVLLEALTALVIAESGASAAVTVVPGQTLVVGLPEGTTRKELDDLTEMVRARDSDFKILFITSVTHFAVAEGS